MALALNLRGVRKIQYIFFLAVAKQIKAVVDGNLCVIRHISIKGPRVGRTRAHWFRVKWGFVVVVVANLTLVDVTVSLNQRPRRRRRRRPLDHVTPAGEVEANRQSRRGRVRRLHKWCTVYLASINRKKNIY